MFTRINDKPCLIVAEVKRGRCSLNGPWTEPEQENLQRVLRAVGAFHEDEIEHAANAIYATGTFSNARYHLSLMCFGETLNTDIAQTYPAVLQILWDKVLTFIYTRFREYRRQKASHGQWDASGRALWECAMQHRVIADFKSAVRILPQ